MKYALFIGRWQPLHNGHDFIIQQALDKKKNVLIAVRDTEITEFDPYTTEQRIEMIKKNYARYGDRVKVIPIPDIESVNIGRKVGYDIIEYEIPNSIKTISATEIRERMANNDDSWKSMVPDEISEYLDKKGKIIWFTGPSGSGKTTLGKMLKTQLHKERINSVYIDADEMRKTITKDLGFSGEDRLNNNKRIAEVAKCLLQTESFGIVSTISPTKQIRDEIENIIGEDNIMWVYPKCSLESRMQRDPKGLYQKAEAGEIINLTGYDGEYEEPESALIVKTDEYNPEVCTNDIVNEIKNRYSKYF